MSATFAKEVRCPNCGRLLFKVREGQRSPELEIKCPNCKVFIVMSGATEPMSKPGPSRNKTS